MNITKDIAIQHFRDRSYRPRFDEIYSKIFDLYSNDKDVMLAAVSRMDALQYASPDLRNDKEVVLAAVSLYGNLAGALEYASDELKADKEVVLAAISNDPFELEFASDELKNDKEFILAALSISRSALYYASDEIRELVADSINPAAKLQSIIEKEKLKSKFNDLINGIEDVKPQDKAGNTNKRYAMTL